MSPLRDRSPLRGTIRYVPRVLFPIDARGPLSFQWLRRAQRQQEKLPGTPGQRIGNVDQETGRLSRPLAIRDKNETKRRPNDRINIIDAFRSAKQNQLESKQHYEKIEQDEQIDEEMSLPDLSLPDSQDAVNDENSSPPRLSPALQKAADAFEDVSDTPASDRKRPVRVRKQLINYKEAGDAVDALLNSCDPSVFPEELYKGKQCCHATHHSLVNQKKYVQLADSPLAGKGLFSTSKIPPNTFISFYDGVRATSSAALKRGAKFRSEAWFFCQGRLCMDGDPSRTVLKGLGSMSNHERERPNCRMVKVMAKCGSCVSNFFLQTGNEEVDANTELMWNYNTEWEKKACKKRCGTCKTCKEFLFLKPRE